MEIMFNTQLITLGMSLSLIACAESSKVEDSDKKPTPSTPAIVDWKEKTYQGWDDMLHISKKCPAKFDGHNERFVNVRTLNDSASILSIACELGAYQDGDRLFILQDGKAAPFFPIVPTAETSWGLAVKEIIWGHRYVEGEYLVLENWFAGSGECGYRAFYRINDVITKKSLKPEKVLGDLNCQNEVFVDDWPHLDDFK